MRRSSTFFFVQALLRVFRRVHIVARPFRFPPITLQTRESHFSASQSSLHWTGPSKAHRMRMSYSGARQILCKPVSSGARATKALIHILANDKRTREFGHETLGAVWFDRFVYACSFSADSRTGLWQNSWNGLRSLRSRDCEREAHRHRSRQRLFANCQH